MQKELELRLDLQAYKKQGLTTLTILLGICLVYFGLEATLGHLEKSNPQDMELLLMMRGLFLLTFTLVGVVTAIILLSLGVKTYQLITFKSKQHCRVTKEGVYIKSPLDYSTEKIYFKEVKEIKMTLQGVKAIVTFKVQPKSKIKRLVLGKQTYRLFLITDDYHTFKEYIKKHQPELVKITKENGESL